MASEYHPDAPSLEFSNDSDSESDGDDDLSDQGYITG